MLLTNLMKAIGLRRRASAEDLIAKGTAFLNAGAWQDATACFEAARQTAPHDFTLLNNLGLCHANAGNLEEAAECFREILRLAPDSAPALMNLGNIELSRANPEDAIVHYEAALAGVCADPGLVNNLGMAYRATAQVDAAIDCFRRALSIEPRFRDAHDNLLYCMQLLPEYGPEELHSEHRRWADIHEAPLQARVPLHANDRDPRRRLRIGYVSPDFHRHAVAKFMEPVLAHHDHERFEVHCYHNSNASDAVTGRIRQHADIWREVAHLSDEGLAALIRADGIDILVDLAGHTRGGRLLCFARKPAPLQLTYLGHGNTTGLRAIDFRITDAVADPPGLAERFHSEQLLRLPRAQWCFRPDDDALPAGPLPALSAGHITFGSFNNLWKINHAVIGAWSRVLLRVPGSRLLIIGIPGRSTRERLEAAFAGHGVDPSRLRLLAPVSDADFWRLRHEIDIALDPFPYNGVTSTCEALYAGTPMATLAGTYGQSRTAASLLTAAGLADLVARTEEEYVEINVRLASDLQSLSHLRSSLRERMQDSPLMDARSLTFALEGLYRGVWTDWAARNSPPHLPGRNLDVDANFGTLTTASVREAADRFRAGPDAESVAALESLRRAAASTILQQHAQAVPQQWAGSFGEKHKLIMRSGLRDRPRDAGDGIFLQQVCERLAGQWGRADSAASAIVAMLFSYPHDTPLPSRLDLVPDWFRLDYVSFVLEMPALFSRAGEADAYLAHITRAVEVLHEYVMREPRPADARQVGMAFAKQASLIQAYFNVGNLRKVYAQRGDILSRALIGENCQLLAALPPRRAGGKIRLGIYMQHCAPQAETYFMISHFEHLDRSRFDITLFTSVRCDHPLEKRCFAAADRVVIVPQEDLGEQVAQIRAADLDILMVGNNATVVANHAAVLGAHRLARIQVASVSSPVTTGMRHMDVLLSAELNEAAPDAALHYTEYLYRMPGSINCYAFQYDEDLPTATVSRQTMGIRDDQLVFFSGANYFKIIPELSLSWARILAAVPDSILLLMPFNPNWSGEIQTASLMQRINGEMRSSGVETARVRFVMPVPSRADVHRILELADIYLDAFPFAGACSMLDPLYVGVPPVAWYGGTGRSSHGAAMLRALGMAHLAADSAEEYEKLALQLAFDPAKRRHMHDELLRLRGGKSLPPYFDTVEFSRKVSAALADLFETYSAHYASLGNAEADAVRSRLQRLADDMVGNNHELDGLTDLWIAQHLVLPFLRGSRQDSRPPLLIDVGACHGAMSLPFVAEGWHAILFEPDPDPRQALQTMLAPYGERCRIVAAAAGKYARHEVSFHKNHTPGLSGFEESPFGTTERVINVPCVRLADYCAENGVEQLDFLKIDAEGYDFDVLEGFDFARLRPRLVLVEYGLHFPRQSLAVVNEVLDRMQGQGYRAVVFNYDDKGAFAKGIWSYKLTHLFVNRRMPAGMSDAFGNILFYLEDDKEFLLTLIALLECCGRRDLYWDNLRKTVPMEYATEDRNRPPH